MFFTSDGQSFSISSSEEYSGLISFRTDWFHLLSVQGTLKSHLQHHNSKATVLWFFTLFMVQLTSIYDYWKNHSLDCTDLCRQSNVSAFNMLSRSVIVFLPRSKRLLISWLQSPSAVILEPRKIKSATVPTVSPIYLPWSDGTGCHDLHFLNVEF